MSTAHRDSTALPEVDDARVAAWEDEVLTRIADEPRPPRTRPGRGRVWLGALGGAAAVLVAVVVLPLVGAGVTGSGGAAIDEAGPIAVVPEGGSFDMDVDGAAEGLVLVPSEGAVPGATGRDITTSSTATVRVDDVAGAMTAIGDDAQRRGGFVESTSSGVESTSPMFPAPGPPTDGGFITVRVPSAELSDALAALSSLGEVTASSVFRQDVTVQTIDLRARVETAEASVQRLATLVAQAESVSDLVAAETALADRQGLLESYRQQLAFVEDQIALSSLSVTVLAPAERVTADPAGFGDGLVAGWNGLVATLNGIVVGVGFLLPWIAVVAIAAAVVWGVLALRRRARRAPVAAPRESPHEG